MAQRDEITLNSIQYTHIGPSGVVYKLFGCAKRGCDQVNPDWRAFGSSGKTYCLDHIPLRSRARLWWQEQVHW